MSKSLMAAALLVLASCGSREAGPPALDTTAAGTITTAPPIVTDTALTTDTIRVAGDTARDTIRTP
jgi:hypothetical protein